MSAQLSKLAIGCTHIMKSTNNLRMPSCHTLIKLADYFEVSTDYLLGRSNKPEINK